MRFQHSPLSSSSQKMPKFSKRSIENLQIYVERHLDGENQDGFLNQQGLVYCGQNGYEGGLREACATGNYKDVLRAFFNQFGGSQDPQLNLAGHCDPNTNDCTFLSNDIISCQRDYNVKVMLSLGGAIGNYLLVSEEEAWEVVHHIWNNFLGGSSSMKDSSDHHVE
uniref:GH18 domain-containing protein n=2 Tax=Musa acuminata subsp. malaccensis TaxID=214687 RepID=A0A804KFI4_MUSAM|nr:PREDICTED: acidic endochitinase-like [Musa acuminata subsp. malaccensis]